MKAQLHANDDNTWSVTAPTKEEAAAYMAALNICLEHPELQTREQMAAWLAEQVQSLDGDDDD